MDQDQLQEYAKQYGQVVAKAWADDDFKARLLADPASVLAEAGLAPPAGVEVRAVENTSNVVYLTIPSKPSDELSDEQLNQVAGGLTAGSAGSISCLGSFGSCFGTASSAGTVGTAS
ncbi:MAG TPA: thiocillin family RiPP [Kouleothrix sp.]|uniref:thiocillin family RiPP n=1 Tax=Kouleothrix sp. TaxID=2779161 RepID=UPI002C7E89BE|nr:thiocillin family RiPP [Kouleothrix sp.]HRC76646.1 thiocillin family RiPP [Kouleothrix sp.]